MAANDASGTFQFLIQKMAAAVILTVVGAFGFGCLGERTLLGFGPFFGFGKLPPKQPPLFNSELALPGK